MTYVNLRTLLKTLTADVFRWAAPSGKTRYIVCRKYALALLRGDDSAVARLPRVQLDIFWQSDEDSLFDDVLDLLDDNGLGYDLQDVVWDDDRALFRGIVQLELMPG